MSNISDWIYEDAIAAITTDNLSISVRLSNILKREGIATLGQLIRKTLPEWKEMPHCGERTIWEVNKLVSDLGFEMGDDL